MGCLFSIQTAGREDCHLTLEHLVEMADSDSATVELHEIVGMVQTIFALIDIDRLVNEIERHIEELADERCVHLHFLTRVSCVDSIAVSLACTTYLVDEAAAGMVREGDRLVGLLWQVIDHSGQYIAQEEYDLFGESVGGFL